MTVPARFEAEYRVRFDEADANGHLRPSGFLRFAQDVAWQHSEAAGFKRDWYAHRSLHWLVRDVDLSISGVVNDGDRLGVVTEVIGWRHVWARRRAEIRRLPSRVSGDLVAVVETDWVLLGTDGRPARLPSEMAAFLASRGGFARRRLELPAASDEPPPMAMRVRPADVDPMGHLNNAAYLDFIDEATAALSVATAGPARHYQVSYLLPAAAGSHVELTCWPVPEGAIACRIRDEAGMELTRAVISLPGQ